MQHLNGQGVLPWRSPAALALMLMAAAGCQAESAPPPTRSLAQAEPASVARGLALAEKWCAECHIVKATQRSVRQPERNAPPFAAIANRPEVDPAYLMRFMEVQHLPMPIFRLSGEEKSDLNYYILSLKARR
jgi:mono/diheme cytochrome c family protein